MKKTFAFSLLMVTILLSMNPNYAQWNASRFDHFNTFTHINTPESNIAFVIGIEHDIGNNFLLKTSDNGETWDSLLISTWGDTFKVTDIHFRNSTEGIISGYKSRHQHAVKTGDAGVSWTDITPDTTCVNLRLAVHFINDMLGFSAALNHLYRTSDGGTTWSDTFVDFDIIDISFVNENIGFYCGINQLTNAASIMKTIDGGITWEEVFTEIALELFVSQFDKIDIVDENTIYTHMKFTNQLYRSDDGGANWTMFVPLPEIDGVREYDFTTGNKGHIVSNVGQIWSTADGGTEWTMEYSAEWELYGSSTQFYDLAIFGSSGFVVGSEGLIIRYTEETPNSLERISQKEMSVYPNPISASDRLTISMPSTGLKYTLNLISAEGKTIYSQAGISNGNVMLTNTTNMESGIYYLQLITAEGAQFEQIVVLR